ncbi:MAG: tRNA 2-thiouridine(34) synthase MnmA [Acidithiobacillus sp.]|nr:tRNA 2-thiouridine(34) synthase MnmA [Acidithiobacillus sp.]
MGRTVIALSGGVDSAVAATLLQEAGHDLIGVTLRLWPKSRCCDEQDIEDAAELCEQLGIPYQVLDYRERFRQEVVDPFISEYHAGRTPNPCTRCNQILKFGALWEEAQILGGELLATGHYVRWQEGDGPQLLRGKDSRKDQSYFLYAIDRQILPRLRFPLGGLQKEEVRAIAEKRGLPVARKAESQDICFVAGDYRTFLQQQEPEGEGFHPGEIVHIDGHTIGRHEGIVHFTVGQRRGVGGGSQEPLYVLGLDAQRREVRVGPATALMAQEFPIEQCNWLQSWSAGHQERVQVKLRYAAPPVWATLQLLEGQWAKVQLDAPQRAITPGQAAVCYAGDRLLGGGIIAKLGSGPHPG